MFKKLGFGADKEFIAKLVKRLREEIPPTLLGGDGKVMSVNRVTKTLEKIFLSAEKYQGDEKLGFLRRVMMLNTFKWELKTGGYSEEFIRLATEGLVMTLVKAARK